MAAYNATSRQSAQASAGVLWQPCSSWLSIAAVGHPVWAMATAARGRTAPARQPNPLRQVRLVNVQKSNYSACAALFHHLRLMQRGTV